MIEQSSDEVLAARAKEGATGAFEELFHRHKRAILNFIYRLIGNRETAEEITQDVFMKAFRNLYLYDTTKKFLTWLYTIARNQAKNAIRDKKYFRDISLETPIAKKDGSIALKDVISDPGANPLEEAELEELECEAQKVLDSLPFQYKEVITLCSIQELTYEEAAKIVGCSTAMVAVRLNIAKEMFMKKLGIDPGSREK
jgi:RNA polymerase sigma factor, sigma-70 family